MVGAVMHKCFGDDADGDLIWISCKVNEWGVCIFWGGTLVGGGEGCNRIYYFAGEFEYIDLVCGWWRARDLLLSFQYHIGT